jgi:erythronate-4-phosphate dehydrogenase
VINASRGEVLTAAALENAQGPTFALDVHRDEPTPNPELLARVAVATPHVAGSTQEAKWEASASLVRQLAAVLHVDPPAPPGVSGGGYEVRCPSQERGVQSAILEVLEQVTELSGVERRFRSGPHSAASFLELRRNSLRRALQGVRIRGVGEVNPSADFILRLKAHGLVFNA